MKYQFPGLDPSQVQAGLLGDPGHVEPRQVPDPPALRTDEMVMMLDVTLETCGVAGDADFPDQSGASQRMQPIVNRSSRSLRIHPVERPVNIIRSRMQGVLQKVFHDSVSLRGAAETLSTERDHDFRSFNVHGP